MYVYIFTQKYTYIHEYRQNIYCSVLLCHPFTCVCIGDSHMHTFTVSYSSSMFPQYCDIMLVFHLSQVPRSFNGKWKDSGYSRGGNYSILIQVSKMVTMK